MDTTDDTIEFENKPYFELGEDGVSAACLRVATARREHLLVH